jgi:histidine ammonia-lyase
MKTLEINTGMNGLSFWKEIYEMPVQLSLSADAKDAIKQSHNVISEIIASGDAAHGINTGFGSMADTSIPPDQLATLISNLVLSHTVGSGTPLSQSETRLVMALKIASLAQGYSGVRPELVDLIIAMVNADILPVIPSKGSVGLSGDLAPLAHMYRQRQCPRLWRGNAGLRGPVARRAYPPLRYSRKRGWRCSMEHRFQLPWRWLAFSRQDRHWTPQ